MASREQEYVKDRLVAVVNGFLEQLDPDDVLDLPPGTDQDTYHRMSKLFDDAVVELEVIWYGDTLTFRKS